MWSRLVERLFERERADHVAERRHRDLLDRLQRIGDLIRRGARVVDGEVQNGVDLDHEVVLSDHGLRREGDDLLAQIDQRSQPVHERNQQRHPWVQRAVVAAEPLNDSRSRLRNYPHSPRERDQQEDDYHRRDDRSNHSLSLPFPTP